MRKTKKIMVAYDLSKYSAKAIKYAADLAESLNAEMIIINVINQRDVDAVVRLSLYTDKLPVDQYIRELKADRSQEISECLAQTGCTHIPCTTMFKVGVPFNAIIEAIKETDADLLVMGIKGRSNIEGVLFGSTAEKMFRRCPIPLLSVRTLKHAQ